jgi:hypothetical protein
MEQVRKLILVTAEHHPLHRVWVNVAEQVAAELDAELEIREEDYVFLNMYGDKDEYGMAWLPQLFAEMSDGSIILLLSKMPLTADHKPDTNRAVTEALAKLRSA